MPVPILKQGAYLMALLQAELTDTELLALEAELLRRVGTARARGVIIDVTQLDVVDSFAARTLRLMVHAIQLRGAVAVVVGIQPEVAFTMVQLGMTLDGIATALDLEDGVAYLEGALGEQPGRESPPGR